MDISADSAIVYPDASRATTSTAATSTAATSTAATSTASSATHARTDVTPRERSILAVLVTWIAVGLAIDTRRHRTDSTLDTFFTSAHALLYAGWVASAVFMLVVFRARQAQGARGLRAVPHGFEAATVGAVLFGIGGFGDMLWHQKFGIEVDLKILFSPTHLILMSAMLMLAFGPVRSAWLSKERGSAAHLWPAVLSTGVIMSVLLVFFQYVSAFEQPIFTTVVPAMFRIGDILRVQSIAGVVIVTILFFAPLLILARRWALPFGSATLAFAIPAMSDEIFTDFKKTKLAVAIVAGGFVVDVVFAALRRLRRPRLVFRLFAALGPLGFWFAYLAITIRGENVQMQWPVELWTGTLAWSALVGTGIATLLVPPLDTPTSWLDQHQVAP
jgi:hypothetical protein